MTLSEIPGEIAEPGDIGCVSEKYTHERTRHLYHCDHRGLPLEPISEDGNTTWSAEYDEEPGLYYNRHRYYDPLQGRYITQNPIGLKGEWKFYQYPLNSVQYIDPLGLADMNFYDEGYTEMYHYMLQQIK